MEDVLTRIKDYALEEIMGDRFGKYAKEIIQEFEKNFEAK